MWQVQPILGDGYSRTLAAWLVNLEAKRGELVASYGTQAGLPPPMDYPLVRLLLLSRIEGCRALKQPVKLALHSSSPKRKGQPGRPKQSRRESLINVYL